MPCGQVFLLIGVKFCTAVRRDLRPVLCYFGW